MISKHSSINYFSTTRILKVKQLVLRDEFMYPNNYCILTYYNFNPTYAYLNKNYTSIE